MTRFPTAGRAVLFGLVATLAPAASAGAQDAPLSAPTAHVIVISVDGLRPDALGRFGAATLLRLAQEGAHSFEAQTILPSKTLPSHTSMLTGESASDHGVTWNSLDDEHGVVKALTIFKLSREAGLHTAGFFSKPKFAHLIQEGAFDFAHTPSRSRMADETAGQAVDYLRHRRPNLMFVHLADTDFAGHSFGWMSDVYGWAVRRADAAVDAIVAQADRTFGEGNYTVIVTSDHGGHDRDHGSDDPRDTTIPWIVWGKSAQAGAVVEDVETFDTAATTLWLLGVGMPATLEGEPVRAGFLPAAVQVAERAQSSVAVMASGGDEGGANR